MASDDPPGRPSRSFLRQMDMIPSRPLLIASLLLGSNAEAQVQAVPLNNIPAQVVSMLAGPGVAITNVFYYYDPAFIGTFTGADSLGLDSGLVIANGQCWVIDGPNDFTGATYGGGLGTTYDPDLQQAIMGFSGIYDATWLTLDIVPAGDTLQLQYVFGSEEYDEYVCSAKDDVMGIFLSGPGISGTYMNGAINIARLPNSDLPVSVNTLNTGWPGAYGSSGICYIQPDWLLDTMHYHRNLDTTEVEFDGYSDVFTAKASVQPGATYQLKISIGDAGDAVYDSAVLLKAGSLVSWFSTGTPGATSSTDVRFRGDGLRHEAVIEGLGAGAALVYVMDAAGRLVWQGNAPDLGGVRRVPLPAGRGVYVLRVLQADRSVSGRVMAE